VFSDAGLTDANRCAQILPGNFGSIQTVKGKYKKEQRQWAEQIKEKRAAEKKCWLGPGLLFNAQTGT